MEIVIVSNDETRKASPYDEDGLYNPSQFNDRLLLGLKGAMSEAELYTLRARLRGGALAKAHRGEFHVKLPIGLIYDDEGKVALHPDAQISNTVRLFLKSFSRIGTACGVVRHFKEKGVLFLKSNSTINNNDIIWGLWFCAGDTLWFCPVVLCRRY